MKADLNLGGSDSAGTDTKLMIGQFVRRNGQYGSVAVYGYLTAQGVDVIPDTKRLFARDGTVETHGLAQHAGLNPKDWVEFDVARNTRPRAQEYKVVHLKRLPRYAVLPESTIHGYRAQLTKNGWRGDIRPGLWAFRLSGDMVLVAEMELVKDKGLRITRTAARDLKCYSYDHDDVVRLGTEDVYLSRTAEPLHSLDWSDEADHIGRVIRSLAGARDSRISEIITWLELHHEEGTGKVSAASGDKAVAMEALRSGTLAARLRDDRELMEVYLAAATENEDVREAVAAYAREGHGAEWERLRAELDAEIAKERGNRLDALAADLETDRAAAIAKLNDDLAAEEKSSRADLEAQIEKAGRDVDERIKAVEATVGVRRVALDEELGNREAALAAAKADVEASEAVLAGVEIEIEAARNDLADVKSEIDRLLAISARLGQAETPPPAASARPVGMPRVFPIHPLADLSSKAGLIGGNVMLVDEGKHALRAFLVLMLSGEVPLLSGSDAADLLRVAETIICPGRAVTIEADPTLISVDDLWSRPGSGMPTLLAAAADAAREGGAVLVLIRGIERSGARFWLPALSDALRSGGLPRGLFVCCTVNDPDHEEVAALPPDVPHMEINGVFRDVAFAAAATLLSPKHIVLETLDPGPMPSDLSASTTMMLGLESHHSLAVSLRAARMVAEAMALLNDEDEAKRIALKFATPTAPKTGK